MRYVLLYTSTFCCLCARMLLTTWPVRLVILHHLLLVYVTLRHKKFGRSPGHWEFVRKQSEAGVFLALSLARLWPPLALLALPAFTRPEAWLHDAGLVLSLSLSPMQWLLGGVAAYTQRLGPEPVTEERQMHRNAVDRILYSKVTVFLLSTLYLTLRRQLMWAGVLLTLDYVIAKISTAYHFLEWGEVENTAPLYNSVKPKL